jgi:hypothetical protein
MPTAQLSSRSGIDDLNIFKESKDQNNPAQYVPSIT